jgi:hypothetical protein
VRHHGGPGDGLDVEVGVVGVAIRAEAFDGLQEARVRLEEVRRGHDDRGAAVA